MTGKEVFYFPFPNSPPNADQSRQRVMYATHVILMAILECTSAFVLSASPMDPAKIARHASASSSVPLNHKLESSSILSIAINIPGTQVAVFSLAIVPSSRLLEGKLLLLLFCFASKASHSPRFLPLGCHTDKNWSGYWNLFCLPTLHGFFRSPYQSSRRQNHLNVNLDSTLGHW